MVVDVCGHRGSREWPQQHLTQPTIEPVQRRPADASPLLPSCGRNLHDDDDTAHTPLPEPSRTMDAHTPQQMASEARHIVNRSLSRMTGETRGEACARDGAVGVNARQVLAIGYRPSDSFRWHTDLAGEDGWVCSLSVGATAVFEYLPTAAPSALRRARAIAGASAGRLDPSPSQRRPQDASPLTPLE